jgi:hypothetical protein
MAEWSGLLTIPASSDIVESEGAADEVVLKKALEKNRKIPPPQKKIKKYGIY